MEQEAGGPSSDRDDKERLTRFRDVALFDPRLRVVRPIAGVLLALASLVLPWIGFTLRHGESAWTLAPSLGAVPGISHLRYGYVVAPLIAVALVSLVRSRLVRTYTVRLSGIAMIVVALAFLFTSRETDGHLLFLIQSDHAQSQIIQQQIVIDKSLAPPTEFFGASFDPTTTLLLDALRPGWFFLGIGGILLAGRLRRPTSAAQFTASTAIFAGSVLALVGVGFGLLAQHERLAGIAAESRGRPTAAVADVRDALSLDPSLRYDASLETTFGLAQADSGMTTGWTYYAQANRPDNTKNVLPERALLYEEALHLLPGNPVVTEGLIELVAQSTLENHNPTTYDASSAVIDSPAVAYTSGRFYYESGADVLCVRAMSLAMTQIHNEEMDSWALTYKALAELRLGEEVAFRHDIVAAVHDDKDLSNPYADEISAGLFVPGLP